MSKLPSLNSSKNQLNLAKGLVQTCEDAGRMADISTLSGMGLSISQMSRGRFRGNLLIANIGGIVFLRGSFDQVVYIHGGKAPGRLAFSFSLDIQGSHLLADETTLKPDYCYGFDPDREVHLVTPRNFQIGVLLVEQARFLQQAQLMGRDDLDENWLKRNWVHLRPEAFANLTHYSESSFLSSSNPFK